MKLTDTLSGAMAVVLGLAVVGYTSTFPPMPGQTIGPALFPTVAGLSLIALGAVLVVTGVRRRERPAIQFDDWVWRPRMVLNGLLVPITLTGYAVAVDTLGFFLTSTAVLVVLFAAFGVKRIWIAPIALAVTFVLHYGFYTLLRVPLPWGLFEGVAW